MAYPAPEYQPAPRRDPRKRQLVADLDYLANVDWRRLKQECLEALDRDRMTVTADGFPAGHEAEGGSTGSTPSTSSTTLAAAMSRNADWHEPEDGFRIQRDEVHEHVQTMVRQIHEAAQTQRGAQSELHQLNHRHAQPIVKLQAPVCAEQHCSDSIEGGRRGRCQACYRWVYRWEQDHPGEQAPPVPAHTIEQRLIARGELSGVIEAEVRIPLVQAR